jgi:toxin-antitoxin system PIN domain toxin
VTGTPLLDVNVLIALFNEQHVHHEAAHDWFADHEGQSWATCPLVENAFLRILSDPSLRPSLIPLPTLADHLSRFCRAGRHEFWPDAVWMHDDSLFDLSLVRGHRQLTDVYLLGLAVRHGGRLVTFDQSIPIASVRGATRASLEVIALAG